MSDEQQRSHGDAEDADTDDSLQPRKGGEDARWQEAAAGESGQSGAPVSGTLGPAGAGMGADTTQQPDPSRDRFRDLNQS